MKHGRNEVAATPVAKPVTPPPGVFPESTWPALKSEEIPSKPSVLGPPPVWTRYIDSRLKQFAAR